MCCVNKRLLNKKKRKNVAAKHSLYMLNSVLYSGNIEIKPCRWFLQEGKTIENSKTVIQKSGCGTLLTRGGGL